MPGIKVHHTDTSEVAWDAGQNVARLRSGEDEAYYHLMYAWQDPDGDPTTKAAYKFPHHLVSADGEPGAAVVRGCQAGIAVLNGSMGGADIPDGDRRGVWAHLAAHLEDAEVEPAELRQLRHRPQPGTGRSAPGEIERRFVTREVRLVEETDGVHLVGYGAVFGEWSEDLGGFREMVDPGAFTKTLQEADVRSLWNHDPNYVLGRSGSGTLRLMVDEVGLGYDVLAPDVQWARDLLVSIRRGDVDGSSFGFLVPKNRDRWSQDENGDVRRVLLEVKLFDVGPVTWPAYPQTSAEARARALEFTGGDAPGQVPHPEAPDGGEDGGARARPDILRRRLELVEIEFIGGVR